MNRLLSSVFAVAFGMTLATGAGAAGKGKTDPGKAEFRNSCALCHGSDGKGTSGVIDLLKKAPPDLTQLSKRNGGKFPTERVSAMIDGREIIKGHGDRDMPAWGDRYSTDKEKAAEYYGDLPYKDTEQFVKSRIKALTDYLVSIQAK